MTLLTAIRPTERHTLDDAVRAVSWSPTGRVLALGADGRALLGGTDRLTAPIGPDPIDCCWITAERVAVVDGLLGVVVAGGGSVDLVPVERALAVSAPLPAGSGETTPRAQCAVIVGTRSRRGLECVRIISFSLPCSSPFLRKCDREVRGGKESPLILARKRA